MDYDTITSPNLIKRDLNDRLPFSKDYTQQKMSVANIKIKRGILPSSHVNFPLVFLTLGVLVLILSFNYFTSS